jgi:CheY-like chemotaxis protein
MLERTGISVVAKVRCSRDALGCIERLQPDVVLIDIELGPDSGFEVAEHLHQHASTSTIFTIIMMSAREGKDFADKLAAGPAAGFITKTSLSGQAIAELLEKR